ncbi:DUF6531 domain-containing protein [Sabulibacter ruber]|uniref:DUF6531 domain-containing protein n=1 Tax=Sabulibacter ruber TaxID=2811901 RepID=UPI001A960407|nr:DUF6531 domain-containing protein [Sabulibacter ruber]
MNPAAKQFDIVMGVDLHIIQPPGPVPPLPIPHPFIGIVFDPMDFIPVLGATILVNGIPRAQAGTAAKDIPVHFPIGGSFIKPPGNEGEMFMGSATVLAEDEPFTHLAHPVLSCHDIGMIGPPRRKKKGAKTLMLPTSRVLPIPMGRPILVGGPPTISMVAVGMKAGFAALGKAFQKFKTLKKGTKAMAALSEKMKAIVNKMPLSPGSKARLRSAICTLTGEPVNVVNGCVVNSIVDFELPGPIPFKWERFWFSDTEYQGPLGQGWFHNYDMMLFVEASEGIVIARLPEGRLTAFPIPEPGQSFFNRKEKVWIINEGANLFLRDNQRLTYYFQKEEKGDTTSRVHYLDKIEDPNGFSIRFEYAKGNTLSRVIDSAGRELVFSLNEQGQIVKIEAPHPDKEGETFPIQSYQYDEIGNLVKATDALEHSFNYAYQDHLLTRATNRNGLSFYYEYDGCDFRAKCFHTWGDGNIYNHKLNFFNGYTIVENSLGHKTTYYHEGGLVRKTIDPNGGTTLTAYNEYNELLTEKNPLGFGPTYAYDERGNQTLTLDPNGATTHLEYNALDLPVKAIDPVGGVWQWQYDEKGNLLQRINPLGHTTHYAYQGGLMSEIINPVGGKTLLVYEDQHNLKMLITHNGQASWCSYDVLGRCLETTDPKGNTQVRKYNLKGWVTETREPDGNIRRLRYDNEGNVIRAKDLHYDVRFEYGGMDRLKARVQAGTRVEFRYDTEEQLTGIVNEHGYAYRFALDANGNVVEEQGFDGIRRVYLRDAAGRVTEVQRPGGLFTQYTHDACDRVLQIKHSDGSFESFAYRDDGELIEATNENSTVKLERDLLGQVVRERQGDITVESVYDSLCMRTAVRSSLGADFTFTRNVMGDVNQVSTGDFQVRFQRDDLGLELEREFSGGLRSRWSRDRLGRPTKQETFTGGGQVQRTRTYQWGVNVRLQQIQDSQRGLTRFIHDEFGNLAWSENPDGSTLFRMPDAVGNLFRKKDRTDRKYGPAGQLLRSGSTYFQYDANGNLIRKLESGGKEWQYEWNASGMLKRVVRPDGEIVSFSYDALGRRLAKEFKGRTLHWYWDCNTLLHESTEVRIDCEGKVKELVTWLFEPGSFGLLAKISENENLSIVSDHLGTPISMHKLSGETVWSVGLNSYGYSKCFRGKIEDCPFRYPGQYEDVEIGLYYNRFRYYDYMEGTYISQDPIGLIGGLQLYKYVQNPIIEFDPFGLSSCKGEITNNDDLISSLGLKDGMKVSTDEALNLGKQFLGKGYKEVVPGSGRFVSEDGTRVFRMGDNDILGKHGGGRHVNFETLIPNVDKPGKMIVDKNLHIFLTD